MESCDLVQDVTTDCSVVAGLSAAINILIGKRSVGFERPDIMAMLMAADLILPDTIFHILPV